MAWVAMSEGMATSARQRAATALAVSPIHALRDLRVEEANGCLVIEGRVASFYHKQLAQEAVRGVAQDVDVINSIDVT